VVNASDIREHMSVYGACGGRLGTVDRVEGNSIKLTAEGPGADGHHHYIPLDWVETAGRDVRLSRSCHEARKEWRNEPIGAGS
jgi:hypothetical protein